MDAREAKRLACGKAADVIDAALAGGWQSLDEQFGLQDANRIRDQLVVLQDELDARCAGRRSRASKEK